MIKIIVDSTSTLTQSQAAKLGFGYLPYSIIVDQKVYYDGIDIDNIKLIKYIKAGKKISTATTAIKKVKDIIKKAAKSYSKVFVITASSKLSAQYNNVATIAQNYNNVSVIDSEANGIIIKYIAMAILQGKSISKVKKNFKAFLILPISKSILKSGRFSNINPKDKFVIFTYEKKVIKKLYSCSSIQDGFKIIEDKYITKYYTIMVSTFDLDFKSQYQKINYSSTLAVHNGLGSLRVDVIKKQNIKE